MHVLCSLGVLVLRSLHHRWRSDGPGRSDRGARAQVSWGGCRVDAAALAPLE